MSELSCAECGKILDEKDMQLLRCWSGTTAGCCECIDKSRDLLRREQQDGHNPVEHPSHYTGHPSGVEAIQITEHMNFCLGNAIKYIWRADLKGGSEDLKKARWYITRELERRNKDAGRS